jgi:hypothetical protein
MITTSHVHAWHAYHDQPEPPNTSDVPCDALLLLPLAMVMLVNVIAADLLLMHS